MEYSKFGIRAWSLFSDKLKPKFQTLNTQKSLVQTQFTCDKTHYALDIKLEMNGVEGILVGVFVRKFHAQTGKKRFE